MKTTILLSLVCTTLTLFSCQKKEYLCQCKGGFTGGEFAIKMRSSKIEDAKLECKNYDSNCFIK